MNEGYYITPTRKMLENPDGTQWWGPAELWGRKGTECCWLPCCTVTICADDTPLPRDDDKDRHRLDVQSSEVQARICLLLARELGWTKEETVIPCPSWRRLGRYTWLLVGQGKVKSFRLPEADDALLALALVARRIL